MNTPEKILFLNGSPKANGGTSGAMASYLKAGIEKRGCNAEILRVKDCITSQNGIENLLGALATAEILVLAFPLYIDSLPYPLTKALEIIAERGRSAGVGKRLLAISNCGFPEAHQNATSLAICRQFAKETGMEWIGGLALGGGQSIDGRLEKLGRLVRNLKKSLDLAADAIAAGNTIPEKAVELMAKPLMPKWFYLWMSTIGGKSTATKNGVWGKIDDRPYGDH